MALPFFLSAEDGILEHFSRSLNHIKSLNLKGKIFYVLLISAFIECQSSFNKRHIVEIITLFFFILKGKTPLLLYILLGTSHHQIGGFSPRTDQLDVLQSTLIMTLLGLRGGSVG